MEPPPPPIKENSTVTKIEENQEKHAIEKKGWCSSAVTRKIAKYDLHSVDSNGKEFDFKTGENKIYATLSWYLISIKNGKKERTTTNKKHHGNNNKLKNYYQK